MVVTVSLALPVAIALSRLAILFCSDVDGNIVWLCCEFLLMPSRHVVHLLWFSAVHVGRIDENR